MARGNIAKEAVVKKIKEAFGEDFVGEIDKKVYVWANDGGERVQIAIAMTCPKVPVGDLPATTGAGFDFENMDTTSAIPTEFKPAEITPEETQNIADLMARLGL